MNRKKVILLSLLVVVLLAIAYTAWKFTIAPETNLRAMYMVPKDAIFFIETEEPVESWKRISGSKFWGHLRTHPYIAELSENIDQLDAFVQKNQKVLDFFGSRKVIASAHMYRHNDYDFLYIVDLKKAAKLSPLKTWMGNLSNDNTKVTYRSFQGQEIVEMTNRETRETLYLCFIENLMLASYRPTLVEQSIAQMEAPEIGRDTYFIEVDQQTGRDNLFRLYFQYEQLDEYLGIYLDEPNEFVQALSQQLYFTGLGSDLDENELLSFSGYTSVNPFELSQLRAMQEAGKGEMGAWAIAPNRTAFYMSVGFDELTDFVKETEKIYKQDEEAFEEYLQNMDKLERFLDISLEEHFMDWVTDEMAVIQTQPLGIGRDNEFALVLKASDIEEAEENLAFISKQIRRKTPVRFKSVDYKGHQIRFLSVKGFFRWVLGKFFAKLEKPYYTTLADFVVFSNHPQTLKNMIDDFEAGNTLANKPDFQAFLKNFQMDNNFFFYMQTPVMFQNLKPMLDQGSWQSFEENRDYLVCFSDIAFQLTADGDGFDTRLFGQYKPTEQIAAESKEARALLAKASIRDQLTDTLMAITQVDEQEELVDLAEVTIDDLSAKKEEEFYESGELKVTVRLKDGLKHGRYYEYYPNGEVKVKGRYRDGQMDGLWKFYDESGEVIRRERYDEGQKR